jgi:cytochrome P450
MTPDADVDFDHFGPEFAADPAGGFRELREKCPVAYSGRHGGFWVLTRRADLAQAALDDATFSSARYPADSGLSAIIIPPTPSPLRNVPIEMDPPESKIYRDMLNPLLSPKVSEERLRPFIAGLTAYFIDRVVGSGRADLITDIASPVPAMFTLLWLGLPVDDWERFAFIQHAIVSNTPDSPEMAAAVAGQQWQYGLIQEAIARKRAQPGDDVISYLVRQEVDGKPISDTAVMEIVTLLIAGGVDTTTSLTGQAIRYLYERPEQLAHVQGDRNQQQRATEEFLRAFCPVTALARTVMKPVRIGDRDLRPGDRVMLAWYAANRDPAEFPAPDEIRLDRFPNRHTAFGLGIHRCLGSNVARVAFEEMTRQVFARLRDLRIDTAAARPYPAIGINSGWSSLPATFTPGPVTGPGGLPAGVFGL